MGLRFDRGPGTAGFFAPMRFEAALRDCEVEGEIPADLAGSFYRVGPNRVYPPRYTDDIPYNGDGMVSMFRIAGGRCHYAQRYIRTERYEAERAAGRALFGRYRNRHTNDPSVPADMSLGTANTHVYHHAGKLMALKEDSPPVIIDPYTLETTDNRHTFDGQLTSPTFTAHPKVDADTGEMLAFAYEAKGDCTTDMAVMSFDASGRKTWEAWVEAPYVCMMHDMAATPGYVLIPTTAYTTSPERLAAGLIHWGYDRARDPLHLLVLPRGGTARDARWLEVPHRCIIHTVSAFERDGGLVMDFQASDGVGIPSFPPLDGSPVDPAEAESSIRRWTIDLAGAGSVVEDILFPDIKSALPRIDDRFLTRTYRYGYVTESGLRSATPYTEEAARQLTESAAAMARFDVESRAVASAPLGEGRNAAEPVFAPRAPDAPEGEGYLLAVTSNFAEMCSELVILDAQRLEEGVLARVILPFRAHIQVHGNWVPAWEVALSD